MKEGNDLLPNYLKMITYLLDLMKRLKFWLQKQI